MSKVSDDRDRRHKNQYVFPWSPSRTISTTKVAEILGVSNTTVRSMIEAGQLKGTKMRDSPQSPYRVLRSSLADHMAKLRVNLDLPPEY